VDLSKTAIEHHQGVLNFVRTWLDPSVGRSKLLSAKEWFIEGHGIIGGEKDPSGTRISRHAKNGKVFIPPIVADVALEECSKAIHKRTDAYHVFLIPRLYPPSGCKRYTNFLTLFSNSRPAHGTGHP
jgi:hypothetical protein